MRPCARETTGNDGYPLFTSRIGIIFYKYGFGDGRCMKFAVTYENGEVFQHFGKTRQFKVFTVEGNKVTSEILDSGEYSHGSLATLLAESGVTTLICGGIGDGARNMLNSNGIDVYTGNSGNADEVAAAFIAGTLSKSSKSTCQDHHDCHCH